MRRALAGLVFLLLAGLAHASTYTAASCSAADVQTAINTAAEGDTVAIPAGSCAWTGGVSLSGKGILIQGAGSGRIVATSNSTLTLTVGSQTMTVEGTTIACCSSSLPYQTTPSFTVGEALTLYETGNSQNYLVGTVTAWDSGTAALTVNVTSEAGTCGSGSSPNSPSNCKRWLVSTIPQTVITNNSSSTLFSLTEDASFNTRLEGIEIVAGTGTGDDIDVIGGGGATIVIQNDWIRMNATGDIGIHFGVNRGLVTNISCDSTPFSEAPICIDPQPFDTSAWTTQAYWGAADTGGNENVYVETSDFHAFLNMSDDDEGGREVLRYNELDNAGAGNHAADTGPIGARKIEMYDNYAIFNTYSDSTPFNLQWWYYLRGGTAVYFDNVFPDISSSWWGSKSNINMTVQQLQRNAGPIPCWGALASGTPSGGAYPAPHQPGYGYVTGTGTASYTSISGNPSYTVPFTTSPDTYSTGSYDKGNQYVGDPEPIYIWGNSTQPLDNVSLTDYGSGGGCTGNLDSSSDYIQINRDYYNGATAKPGYTPYTYPHPLAGGSTNYTLTVTATNGTVSGTNCATGSYASGTSIGVCTATPNAGYSFTGWSGTGSASCSGTGTCGPFSLAATSTLTASFAAVAQTPAAPQMLMGMVNGK